jgi:hypothetical protein
MFPRDARNAFQHAAEYKQYLIAGVLEYHGVFYRYGPLAGKTYEHTGTSWAIAG